MNNIHAKDNCICIPYDQACLFDDMITSILWEPSETDKNIQEFIDSFQQALQELEYQQTFSPSDNDQVDSAQEAAPAAHKGSEADEKQWSINTNEGKTIRFRGYEIARVKSAEGRPRWTELALYRSTTGALIAVAEGKTRMKNEVTLTTALVVTPDDEQSLPAEIVNFFGKSNLASRLYAVSGLSKIEEV